MKDLELSFDFGYIYLNQKIIIYFIIVTHLLDVLEELLLIRLQIILLAFIKQAIEKKIIILEYI
jgi:hypothetical protein